LWCSLCLITCRHLPYILQNLPKMTFCHIFHSADLILKVFLCTRKNEYRVVRHRTTPSTQVRLILYVSEGVSHTTGILFFSV
jgi:hypothetical protein